MPYFAYFSIANEKKILVHKMDIDTGDLALCQTVTVDGTPGPLAVDGTQRYFYAGLRSTEQVATFCLDATCGNLSFIGQTKLPSNPCYLALDRTNRYLLSAYYGAGGIASNPLNDDKTVHSQPVCWIDTAKRAHCIITDSSNRYAFVPHTVEPNSIYQFLFSAKTGQLLPNTVPIIKAIDGAGPRHYCYHPDKNVIYVANENGSSVTTYQLNPEDGSLKANQTLSTLPDKFGEENTCAQIHLHPTGKFLYVANRGHDSIAIFSVSDDGENLISLGRQETEPIPRTFNLDPSGSFLFAAGQGSGKLATYQIDPETGLLTFLRSQYLGKNPMWVMILEL
ncbi:lactonase family protein [Candidatus Poribacteria bacterium]|nr:lactonase family protein [Candidatus Poribacteria bacterium]